MDNDERTRLARYVADLDPDNLEVRRHGNGFLQVDLPNGTRLHIWNPELDAAQSVPTPIHDHRFSFRSIVLYGNLHHWVYDNLTPDSVMPTHHVYEAKPRHDEDTVLVDTGRVVRVGFPTCQTIPAGGSYSFGMHLFHETPIFEYAITVMKKLAPSPWHTPRVLCPWGMEPDNDYDRYSFSIEDGLRELTMAQQRLKETL